MCECSLTLIYHLTRDQQTTEKWLRSAGSYFYMYLKQCNLCVYMSSGHDRNQTRQRSVTHLSLSCSLKLWTESAVIEAPQGKPTGLGLRRHTWQKHTWSAAHHSLTNESRRSDSFVWVCSSKHHNITWIQETGL